MARKKEITLGNPLKEEKEVERLLAIFADMDSNMLQLLKPLFINAAFITVVIEDLRDIINKTGYVEKYENGGGQSGIKESTYVKLHKDYSKLLKDALSCLAGYVPKAKKKETLELALSKLR